MNGKLIACMLVSLKLYPRLRNRLNVYRGASFYDHGRGEQLGDRDCGHRGRLSAISDQVETALFTGLQGTLL